MRSPESFSKFGGEMDAVTAFTIDKGQKNTQLLIQPQYSPMLVEEQISILYCGTQGLLKEVPLDKVHEFEARFRIEAIRTFISFNELIAPSLFFPICLVSHH